jgi:transaldolase
MSDALADLSAQDVSIWLDDINRDRLQSGNLADLVKHKHVVGVTSNPTIFQKALEKGTAYNEQVRELKLRGVAIDGAVRYLMAYDIRWACDVLRPIFERTHGKDGRVSIEVDPRISHDADRTTAEAKGLKWLVDRPNVLIKIPATVEGLNSIAAATAVGVSVNVTLIFGLDRYDAVMDAYLSGLEQAKADGLDLSTTSSARMRRSPCGERQASPTPAWRTSASSRSSTPTGGGCSGPLVPTPSARCGPPRASRIPRTTTPCTSWTWWPPTP